MGTLFEEILSLEMFQIGEGGVSNSDIVDRYACADVYSFSLISWLVLSQCPELWVRCKISSFTA